MRIGKQFLLDMFDMFDFMYEDIKFFYDNNEKTLKEHGYSVAEIMKMKEKMYEIREELKNEGAEK